MSGHPVPSFNSCVQYFKQKVHIITGHTNKNQFFKNYSKTKKGKFKELLGLSQSQTTQNNSGLL